jgi:site-specific DNA-methyltransferase (cytosine-N4-specific)
VITPKFRDRGGSIPPNLLIYGNNDSNGYYLQQCKKCGTKPHPARFPVQIPTFFIRFLTDPGDLVLDPFAGSNTTGEACERESRPWIAIEKDIEYMKGSLFRFAQDFASHMPLFEPTGHSSTGEPAKSLLGE